MTSGGSLNRRLRCGRESPTLDVEIKICSKDP